MKEIASLKNLLSEKQLQVIRFEDLISEPENTLKSICNFIDEDFVPELLEDNHNSSFEDDRAETGFRKTSIKRWEQILTNKQIALIDMLCSRFYEAFKISKHNNDLKTLDMLYMPILISLEPIKLFTVKLKKLISRYV